MTDNFETLCCLLKNRKPGECIPCVILPKNRNNNDIITSYFLGSADILLQKKKEIKFMCRHYDGAAFFFLQAIKFKDLQISIGTAIANNVHYGIVQTPDQIRNRIANELLLHCGPMMTLYNPENKNSRNETD